MSEEVFDCISSVHLALAGVLIIKK